MKPVNQFSDTIYESRFVNRVPDGIRSSKDCDRWKLWHRSFNRQRVIGIVGINRRSHFYLSGIEEVENGHKSERETARDKRDA